MLAELRQKSQITIPKEVVAKLGLSPGDNLEIFEKNGCIYMIPVSVYPKKYVEELETQVNLIKQNIAEGSQKVYTDVDSFFEGLEED